MLHVFAADGWVVETNFTTKGSTLCLDVPSVSWLVEAKLGGEGILVPDGDFDGFAWAEFDRATLKAKLAAEQKTLGREITLPVYSGPIDLACDPAQPYGFAASPPREYLPSAGILIREPVY